MVGQDASTYGSVGENKAEFDWAQNMIASSPDKNKMFSWQLAYNSLSVRKTWQGEVSW